MEKIKNNPPLPFKRTLSPVIKRSTDVLLNKSKNKIFSLGSLNILLITTLVGIVGLLLSQPKSDFSAHFFLNQGVGYNIQCSTKGLIKLVKSNV